MEAQPNRGYASLRDTPVRLPPLDVRIPKWDMDRLVQRPCPFCADEGDAGYIRPDGLVVRHSRTCGAFFVSPSPDRCQLNQFYDAYFGHSGKARGLSEEELVQTMRAAALQDHIQVMEIASEIPLQRANVLDVGCGLGEMLLRFAEAGANVTGIDLDSRSLEFASQRLGITSVRKCAIEDLPETEKYDVILLTDVIEHPLEPMRLLSKAVKLLRPRGVLSIWTPNGAAVAAEQCPITLRVDLEHMQYLTPRTMLHIVSNLGLEIVHLETVGFPSLTRRERSLAVLRNADRLRRWLGRIPGLASLNAVRRAAWTRRVDPREGTYHLHGVLRKRST